MHAKPPKTALPKTKPPREQSPARQRGGQPGNRNGQRHGLMGGQVPKGCEYVQNRVNALRRNVEDAVLAAKGEIGIVDAAAINSILKWERHGLLAAHWLRHEADKLSPGDRLRFSEAIAKASDARDKSIRSLGLDRDAGDNVLDALYARLPAPVENTDESA